ncbi:MAG: hypothetical protein ACRDP6_46710 [Actinoallomurus sp.]
MNTDTSRSINDRLVEVANALSAEASRLHELPAELKQAVIELRAEIARGDDAEQGQRENALAEVSARLAASINEYRDADRVQTESRAAELKVIAEELRRADRNEAEARDVLRADLTMEIAAASQRAERATGGLKKELEEQSAYMVARFRLALGAIIASFVLGGAGAMLALQN